MSDVGGFADFYQFICTTRVIAGRGLVDQAGFEFMKEGAGRVLLVTDEVIRGTGLADRVGDGVTDGGLPRRLSEVGVPEQGIPALVEGAIGDGCTLVNPREPTEEDFAELYAKAL